MLHPNYRKDRDRDRRLLYERLLVTYFSNLLVEFQGFKVFVVSLKNTFYYFP